jgi:hypothetical protein
MAGRNRAWRLLLLAGITTAPADATCVIVIVAVNEVTVAADGLEARIGGEPRQVCKIRTASGLVITGMGVVSNQATGFDLMRIAGEITATSPTIADALATLVPAGTRALADQLSYERDTAPLLYARRRGEPMSGLILLGSDQRGALGVELMWTVSAEGRIRAGVAEIRSRERPVVRVYCRAAVQLLQMRREMLSLRPAVLARRLLEAEIAAQPPVGASVGLPVSILQVNASQTMHWLEAGACAAEHAKAR